MYGFGTLLLAQPRWRLLAGLLALPLLASCGGGRIHFEYPSEQIDFATSGFQMPRVYFGLIRDLRPAEQKSGAGHFTGITFPADEAWDRPVTQIYRDALTQDLRETHLVELVPLAAQADYTLEAELLSFRCRLERSFASYLLPLAVGFGAGMAWGSDSSDRVKRGSVLGMLGLITLPLPTNHRAEAEVLLRLRDGSGEVLWERACLGEVEEKAYLTATSREDQKLVDRFLTKALKRCNGCLVGQLRQELIYRGS